MDWMSETFRFFCRQKKAFHKGRCVGTIVCKMGEHRQTYRGYIAMLVVIKPYRGRGIGNFSLQCKAMALFKFGYFCLCAKFSFVIYSFRARHKINKSDDGIRLWRGNASLTFFHLSLCSACSHENFDIWWC